MLVTESSACEVFQRRYAEKHEVWQALLNRFPLIKGAKKYQWTSTNFATDGVTITVGYEANKNVANDKPADKFVPLTGKRDKETIVIGVDPGRGNPIALQSIKISVDGATQDFNIKDDEEKM